MPNKLFVLFGVNNNDDNNDLLGVYNNINILENKLKVFKNKSDYYNDYYYIEVNNNDDVDYYNPENGFGLS